jgi:hypothetical protein
VNREMYLFVGLIVGFFMGVIVAGLFALFIWSDYDYRHSIDDTKPVYETGR